MTLQTPHAMSSRHDEEQLHEEHQKRALALVHQCATRDGFIASLSDTDNYHRIWGRDGVIIGIAALMSRDDALIETFRRTLLTLVDNQGPHGEIPSNVDTKSGRVSYGGTVGRVDAALWFVIGCGEYGAQSQDIEFMKDIFPALDKVIFLLGAWEFNNRGLLYIPATGDWSDEYIHNGYILYDQLLYLQALKSYRYCCRTFRNDSDSALDAKIEGLRSLIRANYWFKAEDSIPEDVYHEVLFEKGRKAASQSTCRYWLPFFSPHGYGYRFDAFANVLVSLLGVSDSEHAETVDSYIEDQVVPRGMALLPAFHPVIKPVDSDWQDLKITFSYSFKNHPYEFHNCGLWPMLTGFYVADLARRGKTATARKYLHGLAEANSMTMHGNDWSFPEYVHGMKFTPGGNASQCWSASATLMAHYALENRKVFTIR